MRLQRFDLTRYGKFTDKVLDFGTRTQGQPDFHIIYGPNEAGKSTLFSGFLDLIFGIGTQSPYNFLHPYNTMQIGGLVEVNGEAKEFFRLKRASNSLFDAESRPLPESAIRADMGAIERDTYRTMFSLDDETLEQGGENILASKGDLGELLFSASAGLAQLSSRLTDLRNEADQFYKFRGRNSQLQALKAQLADLKAEREQFDVFAADFAQMSKTRDQATSRYEEVQTERNQMRLRIAALEKQWNALPRLQAWKNLQTRFAPLKDLPQPPSEWAGEIAGLQSKEIELRVQLQSLNDEISRLQAQIDATIVDEKAIELAARLEVLEDSRARYVTAAKDLPERRLELRELEGSLSAVLRRLGREGEVSPQNLVLSARVTGQLGVLIETRSGIDMALKAALSEFAHAEQEAKELGFQNQDIAERHANIDFETAAVNELAELTTSLKNSDFLTRQQTAKEQLFDCQENFETKLSALRPFVEDAEALAQMNVPSVADIQTWKADFTSVQKDLDFQQHEISRLSLRVAQLQSEKEALALSQGLTNHEQAADIRQQREQAWTLHREKLDERSANAFENLLRQDDQVQANRVSHLAELTKFQQLTYDHKIASDELERLSKAFNASEKKREALSNELKSAIAQMSAALLSHLKIDNLEDWLTRRGQTLELHAQLVAAERKLQGVLDEEKQSVIALKAALERVGLSPQKLDGLTFSSLMAEANHLLEYKAEWQKLRLAQIKSEQELQRRTEALDFAKIAIAHWDAEWQKLCEQCWLGADGKVLELGIVREILPLLRELETVLEKQASLADRIDKMETDQNHFRSHICELAVEAGLADKDQNPLDMVYQLGQTGKQAVMAYEGRVKLVARLKEAEQRRLESIEKQTILLEHKRQKTQFFSAENLSEVSEKLHQVRERGELDRQIKEAENDILTMLGVANMQAAEIQLSNIERDALENELVELRARHADIDGRCQELYLAKNKADDQIAAVGGDDAIARIEEHRRTILLQIEDGARNYLQLRIGIAAAEQGLIAYRDKHRSSMMERASQAFSTISRGDYLGLATQPGKDGETLIARAADGGSKQAQELSKGTRFQLYLALRVAGYYEFVRERPALPFLADDIMESFDDFRAEETLRLFAQMAEVGQVIYLTHHRHLCDIAKEICPTVTLHNLQG